MIAGRGEFKSGSQELKSPSSELKLELLSVHTIAGGNIVHVFKAPIDYAYHLNIFKIWDPKTNTFIAEAKPLYPSENMHEWRVFSISDDELIAYSYKQVRRLSSKTLELIKESKENFVYLGKLPKSNRLLGMSTWPCWVDAKDLTSKKMIRNDMYGCCILPSGLIAINRARADNALKICDSELNELSSYSLKDHFNVWSGGEGLTALSDRFLMIDCVYFEFGNVKGKKVICDLTACRSYFLEKEVENITLLDENTFICSIKDKLHFFTSENFLTTPLDITLSCGPIRSIAYSSETRVIAVAALEKSSAIYIKRLSLNEVEDAIVNVKQFSGSRPLAKIISQYGGDPLQFSLIYETKEISKMKALAESKAKLDVKEKVSVRKNLKQALHRLFHHKTSKQDVSQELKMRKP